MKVKSLSRVRLFVTPWTVAYQAPLPMGFSRQEYWSRVQFPSPGDLPNPGIEPGFPALQTDADWRKGILNTAIPYSGIHCSHKKKQGTSIYSSPWRMEWLPTPLFLPGEFHGLRSLEGCSLQSVKSQRIGHN